MWRFYHFSAMISSWVWTGLNSFVPWKCAQRTSYYPLNIRVHMFSSLVYNQACNSVLSLLLLKFSSYKLLISCGASSKCFNWSFSISLAVGLLSCTTSLSYIDICLRSHQGYLHKDTLTTLSHWLLVPNHLDSDHIGITLLRRMR